MITIAALTKTLGGRRVLDGLDLEAHAGQVTLLVGANGSGKTTTLRHVCGLAAPDAGRVALDGCDLRVDRLAALSKLAFLPQSPRFHPRLTAQAIVEFYARLRGIGGARVDAVTGAWGLADVRHRPSGHLSGGTRQRLALAILMLPQAPVLVLDEPGLSLDPDWRRFLHAELHAAAHRGATVLVATHLLGEWEGHADRCLVLEQGRIGRELPAARLREAFPFAPASPALAAVV